MRAKAESPDYRAKAARQPFRFWWQAFVLLGLILLMWGQLPVTAVLYETRVLAPMPEPRASYVVLEPAEAAKALAGMRSSWTVADGEGVGGTGLDMGAFDLPEEPQPPAFLEQGRRYPGAWHPAPVEPLPQRMPAIGVPDEPAAPRSGTVLVSPQGLQPHLSKALEAVDFAFTLRDETLLARTGECRFYLETDDDGTVSHVLLLSSASESTAVLARALGQGRARGAARGIITIMWSFAK